MTCCTAPFSIVLFSCLCLAMAIFGQHPTVNICGWIQCANGGLCQQAQNSTRGYHCRCRIGFAGILCEDRVNVTTCLKNPCLNNGNCTINTDRLVKCLCPRQYKGDRCETLI